MELCTVQVVSILLTELALLPIAHGYFLHMCAWPLVHHRPVISFGLSFVLLHWLLGMVRCAAPVHPSVWPLWVDPCGT